MLKSIQGYLKTIYICEDHPLFRQSLEQLVLKADDLELVGTASTGSEAVQAIPDLRPDVVLLDLNLPEIDGFGVLEFVRSTLPESKVVILTSYNDKLLADKARKAGAAAYLLKDTDGKTLLQIVRDLDLGKFFTNVSAQEEPGFDNDREFTSILKLTRTEKKIVAGLIAGASVADLASQFFISENTVKNHKKNIYRKLQVNTQPELILLCQKHGLLD
ncbi:MAG: response regulator transcription factor [Flavobacteriales bacterium]|nr:response regulator transcription factor [Flavobacteriales bacterium]